MRSVLDLLGKKKYLVSDGAWGTFLYERGLSPGDCPELWNDTHPDDVLAIAQSYVDAGADIILTNSFGGNPLKLDYYGLSGRCAELNRKAADLSRKAAGDNCLVLGSIGPTGKVLMTSECSEEEMYNGFRIQADALKEGGADALCVETMSALDEGVLAVKAAAATGLEVVCTFTFARNTDGSYKTMMGITPAEMVPAIKNAGACIVGTNCGNGFEQMVDIVAEIRRIDASTPVLVHANAGLPEIKDGQTVYPETAEMMAERVPALAAAGANIIGGCCGTTPHHIELISGKLRAL